MSAGKYFPNDKAMFHGQEVQVDEWTGEYDPDKFAAWIKCPGEEGRFGAYCSQLTPFVRLDEVWVVRETDSVLWNIIGKGDIKRAAIQTLLGGEVMMRIGLGVRAVPYRAHDPHVKNIARIVCDETVVATVIMAKKRTCPRCGGEPPEKLVFHPACWQKVCQEAEEETGLNLNYQD